MTVHRPVADAVLEPFRARVTEAEVADLRERLGRTRWPDQLPGTGWGLGTDRGYLVDLCGYWRDAYDWTALERRLNAFPQFRTHIDGQRLHFLHVRSPVPEARPLLLAHGWPGSIVEFWDVIGPLTDPARHGLDPGVAFDVVVPSLPGFAFSGPTTESGWDSRRIAQAFLELMTRLGYPRFFAQCGDWGSTIVTLMADLAPRRTRAVHVNFPRPWCEAAYPTLCHWTQMPRGGHFAALEQPDLLVADLRTFFGNQEF
ncbi:epoxide hydrolase 1 [Frankia sp. Ag45/Mut15]|uniref:Epoxide hydrolase 1 n=1 Tax=Frankia umida TaxID=573489 RepID=A0ABT0JYA6_9ACTN|nr:epoxide hydrolase [Frankia umida]MCK9876521.1 epoxide hydrolase 1 [Frankia umida]